MSTAVLDAKGCIVAVNEAWKSFGARNGLCLPNFGVGANYFTYCPPGGGDGLADQLKALLEGSSEIVTTIYPCHTPTQQRWFLMLGMPLSVERPSGVAILHAELTSLLPMQIGPNGSAPTVIQAIEESVSQTLATQLRAMIDDPGPEDATGGDALAKLSNKQIQVLKLLGEGKTNAEIARTLLRSPHTIKLHVSAILKQLNLKSRTQAALLASQLATREKD